jgi:hypothetical protein
MVRGDTRAWAAHSFTSRNSRGASAGGGPPAAAGPRAGASPGPVPASAAGAQALGQAYARGLRAAGGAVTVLPPPAPSGEVAVVRQSGSAGPGQPGAAPGELAGLWPE